MSFRTAIAALAGLLFPMGCTHWHLERNAPGHVDLARPPSDPDNEQPERPADPGEREVVFSPGPNAGLGIRNGERFFAPVGFEAGFHYGQRAQSHYEDEFFTAIPRRSLGVNLGLQRGAGGRMLSYGEVQLFFMPYGIAAGWAWLPYEAHHGPQATLFWGPLYLRATHLLGQDTEVSTGLFFKFPMAVIWSQ